MTRSWKYRDVPTSTLRANLAALRGSSWIVRWMFAGTITAIDHELLARDLETIAEDSGGFAVAPILEEQ